MGRPSERSLLTNLPRYRPTDKPTEVYFIEVVGRDLVKIGITQNVRTRLKTLDSSNPDELRLLRSIPGDAFTEETLLLKFDDLWVKGEWFRLTPELRSFIDSL